MVVEPCALSPKDCSDCAILLGKNLAQLSESLASGEDLPKRVPLGCCADRKIDPIESR